jgi:RNA polymerase sigma-70 factor (ECF subfamily)
MNVGKPREMRAAGDHPLDGDRDLLDRYRRGERGALARIYWAYVDPVERLVTSCLRMQGAARPNSAVSVEDLVQEVFTRAFSQRARTAYDGVRDYAPYLFTIARNVVADVFRRLGREVVTDLATLSDQVLVDDTRSPDPSLSTDMRVLARVRDFLAHLPADLAAVHHQRYELGVSQRDAAQALGITRQRLRTLEKKLRDSVVRELRMRRTEEFSTSFLSSPVSKGG